MNWLRVFTAEIITKGGLLRFQAERIVASFGHQNSHGVMVTDVTAKELAGWERPLRVVAPFQKEGETPADNVAVIQGRHQVDADVEDSSGLFAAGTALGHVGEQDLKIRVNDGQESVLAGRGLRIETFN